MSLIESVISIAGQYLVCLLIGLQVRDLLATGIPGLQLAFWCVLATTAGKIIVSLVRPQGAIALALVAIPPAVVFLSLQGTELNRMLTASFGRKEVPAIEV
jgi:hypothetical protein